MDKFWSFVCKKTWYAIDRVSGIILVWHNGGRTDADFRQLLKYLETIPVDLYYTDGWRAYTRNLPKNSHRIDKDLSLKIERKNINFRRHLKRLNRKTVCYSKSEQVHDNVIGFNTWPKNLLRKEILIL